MTFNAASRLRSLEDRSAALGSRRCELPGMHSVPTSAVLPYASGVGGLSRRLLNFYSQARTHPLRYGEPVTRNPGHHAFALQIVDPTSVYAVGEQTIAAIRIMMMMMIIIIIIILILQAGLSV